MSAVLKAREPSARYLAELRPSLVEHFDLVASATGGVAQLRELILTLAVRGKLVKQDAMDRVAPGGIQLQDERLWDLPDGWQWLTLNALRPEFQNGASSRGDAGGRPVIVLRLADIKKRRVSMADTRQVPIRPQDIDKYRLRDGDILITRVNGSADIVGRFNLVEGDANAIYCDHFIRMRVNPDRVNPRYVALFGDSALVRSRISTLFISTAGQKTVNQGHIGSLPIAVPPLTEQTRIVARVEELMRLCDALEAKVRLADEQHVQLLDTLLGTLTDSASPEELAANWRRVAAHFDLLLDRPEAVAALEQMIVQLAVSGLLVPQQSDDEPARKLLARIESMLEPRNPSAGDALPGAEFVLPRGWEWARIDALADVQGGIQKTPLRRPLTNHYPYLRVGNVQRDNLDLREIERFEVTTDELAKWRLRAGDILIVEGNGSEKEIGRCALWNGSIDPCVYQNHLIRVRCPETACVEFIRLFLNSPPGRAEMKRLAITTSGLFNLSVGKIRSFVVPVPPVAEQSRIVTRVNQLRRLCANLREKLADSQTTHARLADALVESAVSAD